MSSNSTKIIVAAVALSATAQASLAPAALADGPSGGCNHCRIDYEKLNLTKEQSVQIQSFDQEWFDEFQKTQPKIQEKQKQLKKLMASPKSDPAELMSLQSEIDSLQSSLKRCAAKVLIKKKAVLSNTQRSQLQQMIKAELRKRDQRLNGTPTRTTVPVRWQKLLQDVNGIFNPDQK